MNSCVYRFEHFELNAALRELRHADGRIVTLPSRVFDCVIHLIENRDRVVGRDELIAVVWNRADISDNMLAQLVARTRRLLDDTGDDQRIIRTIAGFGYRWIAVTERGDTQPAQPLANTAADEPAANEEVAELVPEAVSEPAGRSRPRYRYAIAAAGVLCCIGLAGLLAIADWAFRTPAESASDTRPTTPAPLDAPESGPVLVLPAIVTSTGNQEWQRLGIMAMVGESLHMAGQAIIPPDNSSALTQGIDVASLDTTGYARLAQVAAAGTIIQTHAHQVDGKWRVRLVQVYGHSAAPLSVQADADDAVDAARMAAEQWLVAQGMMTSAPLPGVDRQLALLIKQAEGAFLGGRPIAAREVLERAKEQFPDSVEPAYQLARMDVIDGKLDAAAAGIDALLLRISAHDEPVAVGRAYNLRAIICYWQDDIDCVKQRAQQAIDLLARIDNAASELGRAHFVRSMGTFARGEWDASLADLSRARMLWVASGERLGIAGIDGNTGIIYRQRGRTHEATALLQRAAEQMQAFHRENDEAFTRKNLALALLDDGRTEEALAQEPRLRELAARSRWASLREEIDLFRASLFVRTGRLQEASTLLTDLQAQRENAGESEPSAGLHSVASGYALARQDFSVAESELAIALPLRGGERCDPRGIATQYLTLARLRARHDVGAAGDLRDGLLRQLSGEGRNQANIYARLIDAEIAVTRGDHASAGAAFDQALAMAQASGAPADLLAVAETFVPWLLANTQPYRAAEVVGYLGDMPRQNFQAALLELQLYRTTGPRPAWQGAFERARALAGERVIPADLHP